MYTGITFVKGSGGSVKKKTSPFCTGGARNLVLDEFCLKNIFIALLSDILVHVRTLRGIHYSIKYPCN